jgi:hypothetical protein
MRAHMSPAWASCRTSRRSLIETRTAPSPKRSSNHVDESREELHSYDDANACDVKTLEAALPKDGQAVLNDLLNRRATMVWVQQEIAYAIGIEVGRRLEGAR